MGKIIKKDEQGHVVYNGLLSSEEIAEADALLMQLKNEIPNIEKELAKHYNSNSILYKYNLGKRLGEYLEEHKIYNRERRYFWNEIKSFATKDTSRVDRSEARQYYEQLYLLSLLDIEVVKKLSWRQWQDLLDRPKNRADIRIYNWIGMQQEKIREDDWREFEKALHYYLKNKETSVFSDGELYELYDSIMLMCKIWRKLFEGYAKKNPKSSKIKNKSSWGKKYYAKCFDLRKMCKCDIDKDLCKKAFNEVIVG